MCLKADLRKMQGKEFLLFQWGQVEASSCKNNDGKRGFSVLRLSQAAVSAFAFDEIDLVSLSVKETFPHLIAPKYDSNVIYPYKLRTLSSKVDKSTQNYHSHGVAWYNTKFSA